MNPVGTEDTTARIDRITYLASLVSNKNEIDQYLDKLRLITSTSGSAASGEDSATLANLERDLRNYLITMEPLRAFTAESLERQLYGRSQAGRLIRVLRWEMAGIVGAAALATVVVALFTKGNADTQTEIAGTAFICLLYFGGAYLFLSCLKRFSAALQAVYRLFTLGFVIGASTVIANLVTTLLYTGEPSYWRAWWYPTMGFALSCLLFYFASRRLALLQAVKSWALNFPLVLGGVAVVTGLAALLPQGRTLSEIDGMPAALCVFNFSITVCYSWLLFQAARASTERYKYSTRALAMCTFCALIAWLFMVGRPFVDSDTAVLLSNVSNLFNVGALIFLFRAGYLLNKLSRQ